MISVGRLKIKQWKKIYHANTSKEIWIGYIIQSRLQNKDKCQGQRTLHNDKKVNFLRRHDNLKCICTQQQIFETHGSKNNTKEKQVNLNL